VSEAHSELNVLQHRIAGSAPQRRDLQAALIPLQEQIVNRSRSSLQLWFAAAGLVLAIGCVNIAHLFFVRVGARRRELAVRRALGAGTARLLWQFLAEGVLISIGGGTLGVATAYGSLRIIQASTGLDVARLEEASIDLRVLLFAFTAAITTALAATFLAAQSFAATSLAESFRSGSAAAIRRMDRRKMRSVFVGMEVAVTMTSLVAAALLLQSLARVLQVERGFRDGAVFSTQLTVTHTRYAEAHARVELFDALLDRVRGVPGAVSAGIANRVPLAGQVGGSVLSVEDTALPRVERPIVAPAVTDPAYFRTVGIPIKAGRIFEGADRDRRLVAVVAEAVAVRAWPAQNPIGRRFRLGADDAPLVEVVGVAGNVRGVSLTESPTLDVYLPYWQSWDSSCFSTDRNPARWRYSRVFSSPHMAPSPSPP
jgi:predicted permease